MSPLGALQRSYYRSPRQRGSRIYTVDVLARSDTLLGGNFCHRLPIPMAARPIFRPCPNPLPSRNSAPLCHATLYSVLSAVEILFIIFAYRSCVYSLAARQLGVFEEGIRSVLRPAIAHRWVRAMSLLSVIVEIFIASCICI